MNILSSSRPDPVLFEIIKSPINFVHPVNKAAGENGSYTELNAQHCDDSLTARANVKGFNLSLAWP